MCKCIFLPGYGSTGILVEPAPTVDSTAGALNGLPCQLILELQMQPIRSVSLPAWRHEHDVTNSSSELTL